jgi:RNA polymerase sigma factor (sigma-70 family)
MPIPENWNDIWQHAQDGHDDYPTADEKLVACLAKYAPTELGAIPQSVLKGLFDLADEVPGLGDDPQRLDDVALALASGWQGLRRTNECTDDHSNFWCQPWPRAKMVFAEWAKDTITEVFDKLSEGMTGSPLGSAGFLWGNPEVSPINLAREITWRFLGPAIKKKGEAEYTRYWWLENWTANNDTTLHEYFQRAIHGHPFVPRTNILANNFRQGRLFHLLGIEIRKVARKFCLQCKQKIPYDQLETCACGRHLSPQQYLVFQTELMILPQIYCPMEFRKINADPIPQVVLRYFSKSTQFYYEEYLGTCPDYNAALKNNQDVVFKESKRTTQLWVHGRALPTHEGIPEYGYDDDGSLVPIDQPKPDSEIEARDIKEKLDGAMKGLSDQERAMINRHYFDSESIEEIAEAIGRPPEEVQLNLQNIRHKLKREIVEYNST